MSKALSFVLGGMCALVVAAVVLGGVVTLWALAAWLTGTPEAGAFVFVLVVIFVAGGMASLDS